MQVAKSFATYGKHVRFRQTMIYGGVGQNPQVAAMRGGVDVLVATPGRLLDLIEQRHVDLSGVEFFVLDEVDRMLDMGFLRDVKKIVSMLPAKRQSLFFSATLAPNIVQLAETHPAQSGPRQHPAGNDHRGTHRAEGLLRHQGRQAPAARTTPRATSREASEAKLTIVFSRTKHGANKLAKSLCAAGFEADAIHGNKSQAQREKALDRFRKGLTPVLVATDVAARGVDVKDVGLVVNYDLPNEPEAYVHRIGRTGRAGADGLSPSRSARKRNSTTCARSKRSSACPSRSGPVTTITTPASPSATPAAAAAPSRKRPQGGGRGGFRGNSGGGGGGGVSRRWRKPRSRRTPSLAFGPLKRIRLPLQRPPHPVRRPFCFK